MPIIRNYGLRWARNKVVWGKPGKGNMGHLSGKPASTKRSNIVNFREQIGLYVLYEPGFVPVYIGQAGMGNARLFARLKNHQDDHLRDRWTTFSWFGFRGVNNDGSLSNQQKPESSPGMTYRDALNEIEGILIQVLEPRLNLQGPKWQQTAVEYVQSGTTPADKIDILTQQVADLQAALAKKGN